MSGVASEDQLPLASQCLALCQTLASQGKAFSFTVTLGSTFTFSMDAKESAAALPKRKKKSSPSTLRRNAARREKFLNRKVEKASVVEVQCPPGISHTPVPFSAMEVERESFKGILHQKIFYCLNLIFWIIMGCGIARFGRKGLKTTET